MRNFRTIIAFFMIGISLSGCAVVDEYQDRIDAENTKVHDLMNKEALRNIVRASQKEPLGFVAIGTISGYQIEQFNLGLPTITFGPSRSATQRQFAFSSNVIQNTAQSSFQANPLITSQFQEGILTPVSPRQLALLIQSRGREPVLLAAVESITFVQEIYTYKAKTVTKEEINYRTFKRGISGNKSSVFVHSFHNDPNNNYYDQSIEGNVKCDIVHYISNSIDNGSSGEYFNSIVRNISTPDKNREKPSGNYYYWNSRTCNYAKFRALLTGLVNIGLTADVMEGIKKDKPDNPLTLVLQNRLIIQNKNGDKVGDTLANLQAAADDQAQTSQPHAGTALNNGSAAAPPPGQICLDQDLSDHNINPGNVKYIWLSIPICEDAQSVDVRQEDYFQENLDPHLDEVPEVVVTERDRKSGVYTEKKVIGSDIKVTLTYLSFRLRSTESIFYYLGNLLSEQTASRDRAVPYIVGKEVVPFSNDFTSYLAVDSLGRFGVQNPGDTVSSASGLGLPGKNVPFLNIKSDADSGECSVSVNEDGRKYCTLKKDPAVANLLGLLQDLRNLNITPSEVNSAVTVRVSQ